MNKMKISFLGMIVAVLAMTSTYGQSDTTYWKRGAKGMLTFSQTSLTNWTAGGQNSITLNGYLNVFANYAKDRTTWENNLELGYGFVDQGDVGIRKSDDRIIFNTKYGYQLKDKLFWSTILDFKTQFYTGYTFDGTGRVEPSISDFMAPGYLTIATGLEWKPSDAFNLLYAPVTGKVTFVSSQRLADAGSFGVERATYDRVTGQLISAGSKTRFELGSFLKMSFKKDIAKNVNYESKLELFTSYETFGNIDINWQNDLLMKVNDWLSASFSTQLIYDDDIEYINEKGINEGPKIQFKQILGVGLVATIGDKK